MDPVQVGGCRSLYLCRTPLQILICERIAEIRPEEHRNLFYVTNADSHKDRHYFDATKRLYDRTEYRFIQSKLDILKFVLRERRHWLLDVLLKLDKRYKL